MLGSLKTKVLEVTRTDDGTDDPAYIHESNGIGFDRLINFVDAVFAIALTLMCIEIAIPAINDAKDAEQLLEGLAHNGPHFAAYLVAFLWIAFYWRANHQFSMNLKAMNPPFVLTMLVYLGIVGLLPFVAGMLGTYGQNPVALGSFALFAVVMSMMEMTLWLVASHYNLFITPLTLKSKRRAFLVSFSPVPIFLISVPLAFLSTVAAISCWVVVAGVQAVFITHRTVLRKDTTK